MGGLDVVSLVAFAYTLFFCGNLSCRKHRCNL